jgi:hypothetical protein
MRRQHPVLAALNQLIQQGSDLRPAFAQIREYLVFSTKERFKVSAPALTVCPEFPEHGWIN